jgi:L-fucose mutarotase
VASNLGQAIDFPTRGDQIPLLRLRLTHPLLLEALAAAGHGSRVLIADGNYPHSTGVRPGAPVIYLNLGPGRLTVPEVLAAVLTAVPVEAAHVMSPGEGPQPEIFRHFRELLGGVRADPLSRDDFYAAARGPDLAVAVATGEQRLFANIMLTVGVVPPVEPASGG